MRNVFVGHSLLAFALCPVLACSVQTNASSEAEVSIRRAAIVGTSELAPDENAIGNIGGGCSATLIAPNLVLTTAHCVGKKDPAQTKIVSAYKPSELMLSFHADVSGPDPRPLFDVTVAEVFLPAEAKEDLWNHDIGLLRLAENVPATTATPKQLSFVAPTRGERFGFIGYGVTCEDCKPADALADGRMGKRRRATGLEILCADVACAKTYQGNRATDGNVFLGTYGPYLGDSGGPALDASGAVIGVLSTVFEEGDGRVNGYVRVDAMKDYLAPIAREAAAAGGYPVAAWAAAEEPPAPAPPEGEAGPSPEPAPSSSSGGGCASSGHHPHASWIAASAIAGAAVLLFRRRSGAARRKTSVPPAT